MTTVSAQAFDLLVRKAFLEIIRNRVRSGNLPAECEQAAVDRCAEVILSFRGEESAEFGGLVDAVSDALYDLEESALEPYVEEAAFAAMTDSPRMYTAMMTLERWPLTQWSGGRLDVI